MRVTVDIKGEKELIRRMKAATGQVREDIWKYAVLDSAKGIAGDASKKLRGGGQGRDTGQLARAIRVFEDKNDLICEIGVKQGEAHGGRYAYGRTPPDIADLANWVEFGTGVYGPKKRPIKPKAGKWLKWQDKKGGHPQGTWHTVKEVKGRAATPFLFPAFEGRRPKFFTLLKRIFKAWDLGRVRHGMR